MDKYTGKRLDGRYEIQELIGVGGMAMVYKAYDTVDDTTVAIKILKDEFLGNSEFIRRFKNESKAIAVLSHPNIVKVNDVSFGDKIQYIVMEYIDGITLKEYISHQRVIPWKEAVHFTVQILQALQHAHEKGIVHRDMKPQNIMLLQDGTIKVTDFGIARFSDNETRTMTDKAIGSVHYIAPEQARGDNTDGKADIYSVGVMLYEMLTGKLPFEADSAVSVAIMQMQNDPKPLREINDKIPEGIEEITLKAMRKDPGQRYGSAKEMLDAIEIFRHNPSVKFRYSYFVDETPTKYVDSINKMPVAQPEPAYEDSYNNYDDEVTGNVSKTIVKWITVLVTLMLLAAIGLMIYMMVNNNMKASKTEDVDVPQFVGMMYDELQKDKTYKFKYEISADYQDDKPMNVVLSQDPEAGSKQVKKDATIKLVINSKSTTTQVPKLKNYAEQDAIIKLQDKYFNYTVARVNSTEVAKGYVIDCAPQEGTVQEIATNITLIVSDGPATEKVEVPDVTDMTYDRAKSTLEAQGFTTKKTTVASAKSEGLVLATDPLAGNKLTKGSLITIQVSDASRQQNSLVQEVELPEGEDAEITVTIFVDGKETDSYSGRPAKGLNVNVELKPKDAKNGKKTVTVYIDNGGSYKNKRYAEYVFDFKEKKVTRTFIDSSYKIEKTEGPTVDEVRAEAISELNGYADSASYSTENWKKIQDIMNKSREKLLKLETVDEIKDELSKAEVQIDAIDKEQSSQEPTESSNDDSPEKPKTIEDIRSEAISEIENYVDISTYPAADQDKIKHIIDVAKQNINDLNYEDEIAEEVTLAKADIDEVGNTTPQQSSQDDLTAEKQAAINEITNYMNKYYYSDEEYENAKKIVSEYTEKINAATTSDEIMNLDIEAQQAIEAAPHRTSEDGNGSENSNGGEETSVEAPVNMYGSLSFDPEYLMLF